MLNTVDSQRVSSAIMVCFSAIARCEQDWHAARRAELLQGSEANPGNAAVAPNDTDSAERLISVLEGDFIIIDAEIERSQPSDQNLIDAPMMSVEELIFATNDVSKCRPLHFPNTLAMARWLAPFIARAQLFDAWLEPAINLEMGLTASQADFRDAFDLDGYLRLDDGALLFRRRRQSWRADEDDAASYLGFFARHLRSLAYIPSRLDCDDPDTLTCAGNPIAAGYLLWASSMLQAKPIPEEPVIAVAPLVERGSDLAFVPNANRDKYSLCLKYDEKRFAHALAQALHQGVHILLVPEMALPEGNPADFDDRMRQVFLDVRANHYSLTGQVGELRLVVAGVLGSTRSDGYHRNYAVVFDANGDQPDGFQQLKLSHWNLTRKEQDRFGVTHYQAPFGALADPIEENSMPADILSVLEIPGVGRTATLICADMSQNNPGDWLGVNAVLDWFYAPVMDKSICWKISDQENTSRPWIVRRSYRMARLARTLVIASNSMAMSRWVNEANRLGGSSWPPYTDVGIGLAVDGRRDPPSHSHLSVAIGDREVLGVFTHPASRWGLFPQPS